MKRSIKIAMASLLVLGSTQVQAVEVDLDVTNIITQSVTSYVKQSTLELEKSLKEAFSFNSQTVLDGLLKEFELVEDSKNKNVIKTDNKAL
ncbi:hypothetical protein I6F65_03490 [Pseudoalteromonas sp. SWXJZ94C]|uniref:hypothetical protein n=1 Tax=Pseudoalteromonas sp. SWXJZ94C TaxID=2792065 RepID=UPI0018CDFCE9|nr:hypothetical protein [Pseudoalteromonas sp. SWXJZ94C]MBH0056014.1 hypothetical protein [Pseudoalteromonas sp. SWXJZ94C]